MSVCTCLYMMINDMGTYNFSKNCFQGKFEIFVKSIISLKKKRIIVLICAFTKMNSFYETRYFIGGDLFVILYSFSFGKS